MPRVKVKARHRRLQYSRMMEALFGAVSDSGYPDAEKVVLNMSALPCKN